MYAHVIGREPMVGVGTAGAVGTSPAPEPRTMFSVVDFVGPQRLEWTGWAQWGSTNGRIQHRVRTVGTRLERFPTFAGDAVNTGLSAHGVARAGRLLMVTRAVENDFAFWLDTAQPRGGASVWGSSDLGPLLAPGKTLAYPLELRI